jgi:AraC-like DNA-binding protein
VDERIERVIDRMHKKRSETPHIEDLTNEAHLSYSHFAAIFKRRTGFSVLDFFIRWKMQRAGFLLDTTDMPIKAIAADLGFEDPLYLSRSFSTYSRLVGVAVPGLSEGIAARRRNRIRRAAYSRTGDLTRLSSLRWAARRGFKRAFHATI